MNNMYDMNLYKYKQNENGEITLKPFDVKDIKICGKNYEEIVEILTAVDLEREQEMLLTMENLTKWCELMQENLNKQQEQMISSFMKRIKAGDKKDEK